MSGTGTTTIAAGVSPLAAGDSGVASALTAPAGSSEEIKVRRWISNRLDGIDLNSGAPARLFHYFYDSKSPRSLARLQNLDVLAGSLGRNDTLLNLLADPDWHKA